LCEVESIAAFEGGGADDKRKVEFLTPPTREQAALQTAVRDKYGSPDFEPPRPPLARVWCGGPGPRAVEVTPNRTHSENAGAVAAVPDLLAACVM